GIALDQLAAESLGACFYRREILGQHSEDRNLPACPLRFTIQRQRGLERSQCELVGTHGPRNRIRAARGDRLLTADENARLRTAQEFVAAERHEIGAGRDRFRHRGSPVSPHWERSTSRPLPKSYKQLKPRACAISASSTTATSAVNPVTWKFERCTLSSSLLFGVSARS